MHRNKGRRVSEWLENQNEIAAWGAVTGRQHRPGSYMASRPFIRPENSTTFHVRLESSGECRII
jgi:hypothetical protein